MEPRYSIVHCDGTFVGYVEDFDVAKRLADVVSAMRNTGVLVFDRVDCGKKVYYSPKLN
jgi:hypothetical protein